MIVLDVMMPVMDGLDFYSQLEVEHPEVARRVLFVTAWADEPPIQEFFAATGRPVLCKPFEPEEFVRPPQELESWIKRALRNSQWR